MRFWEVKNFWLVLFVLAALIPLFDLFRPGLPVTHDSQDHVARMANFYQSLSEGNLVPRWAGNLNWGYGHPILMFLYPLPSYIASFFHFLGFSLVDSAKVVFGLGFLFSGIFMYFLIREIWGEEAGFVAGLFYMFAPYRFVNLYVRGAVGENLAFVWPPLVGWFALKFSKERKWKYFAGASLTLAAMILSHNALSLIFLPFILGYMIWLVFFGDSRKKKLLFTIYYLLITLFGFAISAFFWFPAFFEGKYTLRDMVTAGEYATRFRPLKDFIYSPWSYGGSTQLSVQIGIFHWLAFIFGFYVLFRFWQKKNKEWFLIGGLLLGFLLTLFFLLKISLSVWQSISLLQKFQFPWRFLAVIVFIPAVLAGSFVSLFSEKKRVLVFLFFCSSVLLLNKSYWHAKNFSFQPESFYTGIYAGTTDTGESSPRWSVRFMEEYPAAPMEVIDGETEIEELSRSTTKHEYVVRVETPARLVENMLYFPGWKVWVDGKLVEVEFQDPNYRGLMTFDVPAGMHQVVVEFQETKLRKFANLISLGGLVVLLGIGIIGRKVMRFVL